MPEHAYLLAFVKGFVVTQAVEIPVVWHFLSRHFRRIDGSVSFIRIIAAAFFANMATLPYLWFVYPEFLDFSGSVAIGEATALVAEALLYYFLLGASLRAAFLASLTANGCSVIVGLLVMPPFGGK
ncbi:MAG TPA: hypothetical protein VJ508_07930 [Saprospiraceae bacterium]|nr:hypothetical protein [Saprospiraceae bacterium]